MDLIGRSADLFRPGQCVHFCDHTLRTLKERNQQKWTSHLHVLIFPEIVHVAHGYRLPGAHKMAANQEYYLLFLEVPFLLSKHDSLRLQASFAVLLLTIDSAKRFRTIWWDIR